MRGASAMLPAEVVTAARALPGVAAVDTYRGVTTRHEGRTVSLVGLDFSVLSRHGRILFRDGRSPEILSRALAARGVVVTESFSRRFGTRPGDRLQLATPSGPREAEVEGIFYDYSTDAGAIVMDRRLYAEWWRDPTINSIALYLRPGAAPDAARRSLLAAVGGRHALIMTSNQSLRRQVLDVFDQTFRITYALQAIVIAVAVLGILNTLTALILQRGKEIAVLRAVGAWRGQIRRVVLVEAGLIGVMAHAIGSVCGVALALMLVHVINRQFFGWTVRFRLEPILFLYSGFVILAASLLAGILPARHAARRLAADAMREE
jgi:putative ABC transport system permease protein